MSKPSGWKPLNHFLRGFDFSGDGVEPWLSAASPAADRTGCSPVHSSLTVPRLPVSLAPKCTGVKPFTSPGADDVANDDAEKD